MASVPGASPFDWTPVGMGLGAVGSIFSGLAAGSEKKKDRAFQKEMAGLQNTWERENFNRDYALKREEQERKRAYGEKMLGSMQPGFEYQTGMVNNMPGLSEALMTMAMKKGGKTWAKYGIDFSKLLGGGKGSVLPKPKSIGSILNPAPAPPTPVPPNVDLNRFPMAGGMGPRGRQFPGQSVLNNRYGDLASRYQGM